MNKKALILISLCVIGLHIREVQAVVLNTTPITIENNNVPNGFDEIILQGSLMLGIGPNSIEAGASDDAVYIQFNQNFGNVNIAIYNSNGQQVYSTVVDTSIQQVVIIPFTTAAADTYTVELSHANDYAEGDFEKN